MLNGTQFVEAARALADHLILKHGENKPEVLAREAFRILTSRYPTAEENSILTRLLEDQNNLFKENKKHGTIPQSWTLSTPFKESGISCCLYQFCFHPDEL